MADYQDIRGLRVKYLSADPSTTTAGEVWYNSTSGTLKASVSFAAAWSSATAYPIEKRDAGGFGTQTAGVIVGGGGAPGGVTDVANEWNGASWTATTAYPFATSGMASKGPQTAGLVTGPGTVNNDYNGTGWSTNPVMNAPRSGHALVANTVAQTAAIAVSGEPPTTTTSDWDGSTWTAGPTVPTWGQGTSGGGTTAAGFCQGNVISGTATLDYNGSSWSAGNSASNGHNYGGAGGTVTDGITFGGTQVPNPGTKTAQAELYDGTNWSTGANMGTGRSNAHGNCTINAPACLCATGNVPPAAISNLNEEYNAQYVGTQTLTTS